MKGLVIGASGQVGSALRRYLLDADFLTRSQLDLSRSDDVRRTVVDRAPDYIINAAAYTAVDKAELEQQLAMAVNDRAVGELAAAAGELGVPLFHFSTDYVFSGHDSGPYRESSETDPINVYGRSKLLGERRLEAEKLRSFWILRCSWVFSEFGSNFVKTILRLSRGDTNPISVVADQQGRPTYAGHIARVVSTLLERWKSGNPAPSGLYHCASNGVNSWYEFACEIVDSAFTMGLIGEKPSVQPIGTSDYPTAAGRPANSVLNTDKLESELGWLLPPWQEGLVTTLEALREAEGAS